MFRVLIGEGDDVTEYEMTCAVSYQEKLIRTEETPEKFIVRAFSFLLEREPQEAILASFELSVIQDYFPEFEEVIQEEDA